MNIPYIPQTFGLGFGVQGLTQTAMNEPLPLNRDDNRDPDIKARKRRGFINQGSRLEFSAPLKT